MGKEAKQAYDLAMLAALGLFVIAAIVRCLYQPLPKPWSPADVISPMCQQKPRQDQDLAGAERAQALLMLAAHEHPSTPA